MPDQEIISCFGRRLRQAREARRLSQRVLAQRLGIPQDTLSMYESGKRSPRLSILYRLALALEVDTNYFFALPTSDEGLISDAAALLSTLPPEMRRYLIQVMRRVSAAQQQSSFFDEQVRPLSEQQQTLMKLRQALADMEAEGAFEPLEMLVHFSSIVLMSLELKQFSPDTYQLLKSIDEQGRRVVKVVVWHVAGRRMVGS
jgi:transcriptional regulator with XRE-family HTH domain